MPVILTEEAEWDLWMSDAPWSEVASLQRPLPDGALQIVARGLRQDDEGIEGRSKVALGPSTAILI